MRASKSSEGSGPRSWAISSIHLLQRFLEANTVANDKLYVLMAMHLTFVVSALLLTYIDRMADAKKVD